MIDRYFNLSRTKWLKLRHGDVTSTEVSALFNQNPYITAFQLWHEKKEDLPPDSIEQTERMKWGKRLEQPIAAGVAQDHGVKVKKYCDYERHPTVDGMGSSFDRIIYDKTASGPYGELANWFDQHGPGLMEIKNVDSLIHRFGEWEDDECPVHIEAQLQYQLEIAGLPWGCVVAFVGGNTPHVYIRERDQEIGKEMIKMVTQFWSDIERGIEPDADYLKDAAFIDRLYGYSETGKVVDMSEHNRVPTLVAEYQRGHELVKTGDDIKKAAKAELRTLCGDAERITVGPHTITMNMRAPVEVAATTRKGYRDFRITTKKEPKNDS